MMIPTTSTTDKDRRMELTHHVNGLLHTLRGEQFRHSQNVRRSRSHLSTSARTPNWPTLPASLIYPSLQSESNDDTQATSSSPTNPSGHHRGLAGPMPPKSWISSPTDKDTYDSPSWRSSILSVTFDRLPLGFNPISGRSCDMNSTPSENDGRSPMPLTLLCLRVLLDSYSGPEFAEDIVPHIPSHLRRDLLRYTALKSPLPNSKLYPLCEPEGHADGELILVGPYASVRSNHFQKTRTAINFDEERDNDGQVCTVQEEELSWESPALHDEWTSARRLYSLVLISVQLTVSTFLILPPTITHLTLVDLPSSIPLHRLPGICPLIVVLDLSYNRWLSPADKGAEKLLAVGWSRWSKLKTLGLRACQVNGQVVQKVNKGRWNDIEIIR